MKPFAPNLDRPLLTLSLALLALFGLVSSLIAANADAAGSGSIVFIKNQDVWLSEPDGSGQFRVTWDGTEDFPYRSPSQADNGTIAVSQGTEIVRMKQNGEVINRIDPPPLMNTVSHPMDGVPVDVAISPNGKLIAWSFATYECPIGVSCGARSATGYTDAGRRTPVSKYGSTYFDNPSWAGDSRTIQGGGYGSQVMLHDLGREPVHWFDDRDYAEDSTDLGDTELSPDGSRLATIRGYGDDTRVFTYDVSGNARSGPAPAVPSPRCMTNAEEGVSGPTWAPDSDHLAWQTNDGIWTVDMGDCGSKSGPILVIPDGSEPDWGPARVNPKPGGIRLPYPSLRRALKKGLVIDFISIGKARVKFTVKLGRRVVGSDQGMPPASGPMRATVKFRKSARKQLTRIKRAKLRITLTQAGKTVTATGLMRR